MFYNCKAESIDEILSKPSIGRKHSEVSFSQNFLDNLGFPMEQIIDESFIAKLAEAEPSYREKLNAIGKVPSFKLRFTKDPITLAHLN